MYDIKEGKNMTDKQTPDVAEMDALFRRVDFAAETPALSERLWAKIQMKLAAERELSEDELSELVAAGAPEQQATEALRSVLRQNERGR